MESFSKEISDFKSTGKYKYSVDEGGNFVFDEKSSEFNKHYISLPLTNIVYDINKVTSFYDVSFKEFIPQPKTVSTENVVNSDVNQLTEENKNLKERLETVTQLNNENITESERLAVKQIIISLRIQLKQGSAERDFSTTFPYLPITPKS